MLLTINAVLLQQESCAPNTISGSTPTIWHVVFAAKQPLPLHTYTHSALPKDIPRKPFCLSDSSMRRLCQICADNVVSAPFRFTLCLASIRTLNAHHLWAVLAKFRQMTLLSLRRIPGEVVFKTRTAVAKRVHRVHQNLSELSTYPHPRRSLSNAQLQ